MKTLLTEFIDKLKSEGFKVYTSDSKKEPTYYFFVKDNKIGYVQNDTSIGLHFSTVHKPCREAGTGFRIHDTILEPTIQHAKDCFIHRPSWSSFSNHCQYCGHSLYKTDPVVKYKDWNDYISKPINQILKYREV